ncbi:bifunctional RNase H/acid phosphatase [Spongiactinospora gelatinilytica]|uniref:Bifunctional RNase H/acid phosphatase n=1 Tax=Spongiactinospora gelatinilytica TaxID=2666298 RepID=A0A2W2GS76_9ACTN|nr:bifunctional RNase H/acid phosphatase [Spongiactinospora gelatinilytica]PZG50742.1 bifunctional RNase H/acid phosphatase [Spongiactinospora gelatinilytica]
MTAGPFVIEADGGSRGNPGPAGYGAVLKTGGGRIVAETAEAIGVATNNVAEYRGLIAGLGIALAHGGEGVAVEVRMDSKLVIEQMAGRWKVKHEGLRPLAIEAAGLARRLRVTWTWIPRERNTHADRLANEAMDAAAEGLTWSASAAPAESAPDDGLLPTEGPSQPAAPDGGLFPADGTDPLAAVPAGEAKGTGWRGPVTAATTLLLLRHGETPLSAERRFSGVGDPELTPGGVAQAEAAAVRLAGKPYEIDVIVTSPLARARGTAAIVAARAGAPVIVDDGLREADFGDWEGSTFTEVRRNWPDALTAWLADPAIAPPGGESFESVSHRVQDTLERLLADHAGKTILAVSHVTPIKTFLRLALAAPPAALYRMHLDLACLSVIEYYADGPAVVKSLNDTAHLS